MTDIALGLGAYNRGNGLLPEVKCINLFAEETRSSSRGVALLQRPALSAFTSAGNGPCRGLYRRAGVLNGDFLHLSGANLYRVTEAGAATLLGEIPGFGRVSIAGSGAYAVIANNTGGYYTDGSTVTALSVPDLSGISSVDYLDGYFLFIYTSTEQFGWTAIGGITIDALDFASAEQSPDALVCLRVLGDEVWLIGKESTEVWVPTGNADLPFQRVNGRVFPKGCINRDTVAVLDNTLFWVGNDHIVYRAAEVPTRVSTNSIEERIRNGDKSTLRAWCFPWDGHLFYALTIGGQGTFVFDVSTGQWCEFTSYNRAVWRAHLGAVTEDYVLAGDDETGQLWKMSDAVFLDGTDPIQWEATAGVAVGGGRPMCHNLHVDISKGTAPVSQTDHYLEKRHSDDGGRTFTDWHANSLGALGEYETRVTYRREGSMRSPGRVIHLRCSSPLPMRITAARINEKF
jgi:hypothetical protein